MLKGKTRFQLIHTRAILYIEQVALRLYIKNDLWNPYKSVCLLIKIWNLNWLLTETNPKGELNLK